MNKLLKNINYSLDVLFRNISTIMLYTTNRCNSKCKICNTWQTHPKVDMSRSCNKEVNKFIDKLMDEWKDSAKCQEVKR